MDSATIETHNNEGKKILIQNYKKGQIMSNDDLKTLVNDLDNVDVKIGDTPTKVKMGQYYDMTFTYKDKSYTKPIFMLKDVSIMSYKDFSNGHLLIRTDGEYEQNIYKLLGHIHTKLVDHFNKVPAHYCSLYEKYNCIKIELPTTRNSSNEKQYDYDVIVDRNDGKINCAHNVVSLDGNKKCQQLNDMFDDDARISGCMIFGKIFCSNKLVSLKAQMLNIVVDKEEIKNPLFDLMN